MKKLPLYVALDVDSTSQALQLAKETAPYVEGFKVGPRLLLRSGPAFISQLKLYGKVFLDLKFFDIPSTMLSAVQSAFEQGADMVTVHAMAGTETLQQLASLSAKLTNKRPFRILSVTVLTSFQQANLPPLAKAFSLKVHVESLANMVIKSGLRGLVCSGHEVVLLRQKYPSAYLLAPGLRLKTRKANAKLYSQDQKRVFTPQSALQAGANALVMGRPIYQAKDPAQVCAQLQALCQPFLSKNLLTF